MSVENNLNHFSLRRFLSLNWADSSRFTAIISSQTTLLMRGLLGVRLLGETFCLFPGLNVQSIFIFQFPVCIYIFISTLNQMNMILTATICAYKKYLSVTLFVTRDIFSHNYKITKYDTSGPFSHLAFFCRESRQDRNQQNLFVSLLFHSPLARLFTTLIPQWKSSLQTMRSLILFRLSFV